MKTNLELSKLDDPWELISQPTLFYKHIAPRGSKYALLGIISGIISGILTSIYKELKDKCIFENNILETMLQSKILEKINLEDGSFMINTKEILFDEIIQFKNDVKFLPTNKIKKESINKFKKILFDNEEINPIENNLNKIGDYEKIILLTRLGSIDTYEIRNIKSRLQYTNKKLFGIIII